MEQFPVTNKFKSWTPYSLKMREPPPNKGGTTWQLWTLCNNYEPFIETDWIEHTVAYNTHEKHWNQKILILKISKKISKKYLKKYLKK